MNEFDLELVFKHYDASGDGNLDFKEFCTAFISKDRKWFNDLDHQESNNAKYVGTYLDEKNARQAEAAKLRRDSPEALLQLFRDKVKGRGPRGIVGLQKIFAIMDDDESGTLTLTEFAKACRDFKIGISEENVPTLFSMFDANGDGTLQYAEFIFAVRGDLNERRMEAVKKAWAAADTNNSNTLHYRSMKETFNASKHPDVVLGQRSEQAVLNEFLETFDAHHNLYSTTARDSLVTEGEFVDYYRSVSASIESDEAFILMVGNSWTPTTNFGVEPTAVHRDSPVAKKEQTIVERPSPKKDFRKGASDYNPGSVYRSGMASTDLPINNTKDYYPSTHTAALGSHCGGMYGKPTFAPVDQDYAGDGVTEAKTIPKGSHAGYKRMERPVQDAEVFIKGPRPTPKYQGIMLERFRKALKSRGGRGIIGLKRQFKIFDDDNSGMLDFGEFEKAIKDYNVEIDDQDVRNLFKSLDIDGNQVIDFNEFLRVVVGDMGPQRENLVQKAFRILDFNNNLVVDLEEIKRRYNARQHPEVRSGKRTEDEVLTEFMETFEAHHNLKDNTRYDGKITYEEFLEYYQHISCNIDNDNYFDLMMTNAWNLDGTANPYNQPYAGTSQKISKVNPREAYLNDHHRNLFGTDKTTPFAKGERTTYGGPSTRGQPEAVPYGQGHAAGAASFHNRHGYTQSYNSSQNLRRADYTGVKHSDDALVVKLRMALAARGARGIIGLQRVFKIIDDDNSGTIDIQEFWKAMQDFRVKISQEEARRVFDLFDENDDGVLQYEELLKNIKGPMNDARKTVVKRAFDKMDFDKNGFLDAEDIRHSYKADKHPDVLKGTKTEEEVYTEFLETFEAYNQ